MAELRIVHQTGLYCSVTDGERTIDTCPCCNKPITIKAANALIYNVKSGALSLDELFARPRSIN